MKRLIFTFYLILLYSLTFSQDSIKSLSASQVMQLVKLYHPVAKQASLLIDKAKADVTIAKGVFDPLIINRSAQKTFDGIAYYNYHRPEVTIPTWFGVEISAGLENLTGARTVPSETSGKTSFVGLSIPLAKNLLMDKRRAALQTAKIFREASEVERKNILNNLLLEAMKAYWYWVQNYQIYKILSEAVEVNEKRVALVKAAYNLGDRPAVDTTEALAQLQNFLVLKENAWMQFQNAGLELSVFLWDANDKPVVLPADVIPANEELLLTISSAPLPVLNDLIQAALYNHPELVMYNYKLDALQVDKKLKFQGMLPILNFRYNHLGKGYNILKTATRPFFENNYQFGIQMGIPLRLSAGRGEYRKAKLTITETQLSQSLKRVEIENKVKVYFNELVALKNQVALQEKAFENLLQLQRAEETRFKIGESSLFLINARENKTLEALQKLQELKTKYLITLNLLQWAAGLLVS